MAVVMVGEREEAVRGDAGGLVVVVVLVVGMLGAGDGRGWMGDGMVATTS